MVMEIPWDRNNNKIDELKEKKNDKDKDSHVILSKSISESKDESNSRDKEKETICKETTLNSVCTDKHSPAKSNMNHKSKQSVDKADRKVSKQMRDLNENISKEMENDIPLVRIVGATPSPRPPDQSNDLEKGKSKRYRRKLIKEDVIDEDDELDEDDDDECEEEEEDVEEEEEETEMTTDEKKAMYEAVLEGDIDILEDCLDLPNADINMVWFQENLLMTAIRAGHTDVAEFLIDNGVDHMFSTSVMNLQDTPIGKVVERYEINCRQMAFDRDFDDLVFLIDALQDNIFPFVPRPVRTPRLRRPKPSPSDIDTSDYDDDDEDREREEDESKTGSLSEISDEMSSVSKKEGDGNDDSQKQPKKKKMTKKRKRNKSARSKSTINHEDDDGMKENNSTVDNDRKNITIDDEDGDKDKTFRTGSTFGDVDSGNYSMASSKLKKSMLKKHDKYYEKEDRKEDAGSASVASPRKSDSPSTQNKSQRSSKKSKGEKTDRTSTAAAQDESHTSSLPTESIAPSRSVVPEIPAWAAALNPPTNRIRNTKATVAIKYGNMSREFYKTPLHFSTTEKPLQWKKITAKGSYARESRLWHIERKLDEDLYSDDRKQLGLTPGPDLILPFSTQSPVPTVSQRVSSSALSTGVKSQMSQRPAATPSEMSDSISLTTSNQTGGSLMSDKIDGGRLSQNSLLRQSNNSRNTSTGITAASIPTTSSKLASYMRPTQSTRTKQRLGPIFVDSYAALDFQAKPSNRVHDSVPNKNSKTNQLFQSEDYKKGILKSSNKTALTSSSTLSPVLRSQNCVPVVSTKSVYQRRNENFISHRIK